MGDKIVFQANLPPAQIFVMNADGSNQQALTSLSAPPGGQNLFPKRGGIAVGRDPQ